jgi:hypothetical protein
MYFVEYVLRCCKDKSVLGCDNASVGQQSLTSPKHLLLGLPDPENEGNMTLQNYSLNATALYPRTLESNTIQEERSMNRYKHVLGQCS